MPNETNVPEKLMPTSPTKKIILVAEDDEGIGTMLARFISDETPYEVLLVTNGRKALQLVQQVKPALFLLDYHLPSMTGLELYDQFQTLEELKGVPAIMISANLPTLELAKRQIIGLKKPFDLDDLLDLIERALGQRG